MTLILTDDYAVECTQDLEAWLCENEQPEADECLEEDYDYDSRN